MTAAAIFFSHSSPFFPLLFTFLRPPPALGLLASCHDAWFGALGLSGFFSSNNSLLSCILLSCFPLLNVTSPPLLFWMNDQKKKIILQRVMIVSLLDDCLLVLETQLQLELPLHFLVAMPSFWPTLLSHLGGRRGWEMVGEQHVLKKVTVCCFAVLHLVKVVTPQVPTFQPIAIHLLLPHPLPLVHPPLGAASGNLPLALHQSVQTLLHLYNTPGKASWSRLSYIITVNASGNT